MSEGQATNAVNFSVLEAYARGDEALTRDVLTIFCAEALEWIRHLEGEGWRAVVHTMKGTARTIGANRLGELCQQSEDDGRLMPEVRAELDAVMREVNDYLARR